MIQKKVCMLGAFAVGKTSLVRRYVHSIFSDRYQTTVGVKVDKREVVHEGRDVTLVLWDMVGKDDYTELATSQVRGAAGYLLVLDPTRPATWDVGTWIHKQIEEEHAGLPFVVALNKHDIKDRWALTDAQQQQIASYRQAGWHFVHTSAQSGEGVEALFEALLSQMFPSKENA